MRLEKDQVGLCNDLNIKDYFHFNDDSLKLTYQKKQSAVADSLTALQYSGRAAK